MTRSDGTMKRAQGTARYRRRIGVLACLATLFAGLFVTTARAAHALLPCPNPSDLNTCPTANDDEYTAVFGKTLTVDAAHGLLANDEGTPGTHVLTDSFDTDNVSFPGGATVHVKADGSFTYTPNPAVFGGPFSGDDSFSYTIATTGDTSEDFADVTIHVPAIARNDTYGTGIDHPLTVAGPGVAANDTGIDPTSIDIPFTSDHGTISDDGTGGFVYTPNAGFVGTDSFQYTGWDYDFDNSYMATVTIFVDGTPPTASMSAPGLVTLDTRVPAAWSGTDDQGVANYDTRYTIAPWNGPFAAWTNWRTATTATTGIVAGTYGRTFCFQARARDHAGNVSPFTASRCTSVPLSSRSLVYSKLWTRKTNAVYFSGDAFITTTNGQNASRTGVSGKRMWLVATKCPTCGTVQVRFNNVVIANVNTAGPVTVRHALFPIASFPAVKAGTMGLYVTSPTGKSVIIEGLAVLRA